MLHVEEWETLHSLIKLVFKQNQISMEIWTFKKWNMDVSPKSFPRMPKCLCEKVVAPHEMLHLFALIFWSTFEVSFFQQFWNYCHLIGTILSYDMQKAILHHYGVKSFLHWPKWITWGWELPLHNLQASEDNFCKRVFCLPFKITKMVLHLSGTNPSICGIAWDPYESQSYGLRVYVWLDLGWL